MKPVPISRAKAELSKLVARACAGEEIIIARGKRPLVKLVPVDRPAPLRMFGAYRGRGKFDDTFFDPLSASELAIWEGRGKKEKW